MNFNKKTMLLFFAAISLAVVSGAVLMASPQVKKDQAGKNVSESQKPALQDNSPLSCTEFLSNCQKNMKESKVQIDRLQTQLAALRRQDEALKAQVAALQQQIAKLHDEKQALYNQVADLQLKAALPMCSNRTQWIHPTIPTVECSPYSCDTQPFACHMTCNSKLNCADKFVCTARGTCEREAKVKTE